MFQMIMSWPYKALPSALLLIVFFVFGAETNAAISLPYSSTYNCAEQNQKSQLWITGQVFCDGQSKYGDWTTSNGSLEAITTAANYSGGAGGRGQRHFLGQSSGNTNGSGGIHFGFTARVQEFWVRYYTRFEAGLKLGGNAAPILRAAKMLYTDFDCGVNSSGGCGVLDIEGNTWSITVSGTSRSSSAGTGWDGLFGGATNAASDGRWMCWEFHFKNETNDSLNDGVMQVWVDGVQKMNFTNMDWKASTGWTGFNQPANGQFTVLNSAVDMAHDFDDTAIQTTGPIGCLSSSSPPASPSGFKIASLFSMFIPVVVGVPLFGFAVGRLGRKE